MKSIANLCTPKSTVFDASQRDTVHDILDLKNKNIDPAKFFDETYFTAGMKSLIKNSFERLSGQGSESVFRLSQSMGGGKTHSMIALGLLAEHAAVRKSVFPEAKSVGDVRVAVISGRMKMKHCLWGEVAEQLGNLKLFGNLVSPPEAPSQEEWEELLSGQPTILLFDELAPYLEGAAGKTVGGTTLAGITTVAIANLLNAVSSDKLSNCVAVFSDLSSSAHASGGQAVNSAFQKAAQDTGQEIDRFARVLEPVQINTDEFYKILRKRIFENEPDPGDVKVIVNSFGDLLEKARSMGYTDRDPTAFKQALADSYPFHPGIRDLYARFKENQGFQQTRALIRMMRIIVSGLWNSKRAESMHLIGAGDFEFTTEMVGELEKVNSKLEPAISADVEDSSGNSAAQNLDAGAGTLNATSIARTLYLASLSTATSPVLGLSQNEIVYQLLDPSRDLDDIYSKVIPELEENCTFLHRSAEGRLYFRDVQNLVALINRIKGDAAVEVREKVLAKKLDEIFSPTKKHLYQSLKVLTALGDVNLTGGEVTMVVFKPTEESAEEIKKFFIGQSFKNRVLFLTGQEQTYESVLDRAAFLHAIDRAEEKLRSDDVPATDPQFMQASDLRDKYRSNFYLAIKDCFTVLHYPMSGDLIKVPVTFTYKANEFNGEEQIVACLKDNYKYLDDVNPDGQFRDLAEDMLWLPNAAEEKWSEIRNRAAMDTNWNWHPKAALDSLKMEMVSRGQWKEYNGFVHKGPHAKDKTSIRWTENRDPETQEVILNLVPEFGDTIHYEEGGKVATESSPKIDKRTHKTTAMEISFLVVDSKGEHKMGDPMPWTNKLVIKHRVLENGAKRKCELKAYPDGAVISYTTDNMDPAKSGSTYSAPFELPDTCKIVQAIATLGSHKTATPEIFNIAEKGKKFEIKPNIPATWKHTLTAATTAEVYNLLDHLQSCNAKISDIQITAMKGGADCAELMITGPTKRAILEAKDTVKFLQDLIPQAEVNIDIKASYFELGSELKKVLELLQVAAKAEEIKQ
ncbi:DUF499 domain-containing protein [Akkermansiaceae bacterium]|nr:DUF499 domain-containing protein [Akkermansiaceae bacterium]